MQLETIRIRNLRACKDVTVPVGPYTCLVGPNGAGKSTVLTALNIFFRENQQPTTDVTRLVQEDFHQKDTTEPVNIILTFTDLSDAAKEDFKEYFRNGKLVITTEAAFDPARQHAEVQQYGERLVMPELAPFFKAEGDGAKVADLKTIYNQIRETIPDLPAPGTKDAMVQALRSYENEHQERCRLLRSKDEFYGISKGKNRLQKYVQWVYVPAVKDASTEQVEQRNTALSQLLARTVRARTKFTEQVDAIRQKAHEDYEQLLQANQQTLKDLSAALQQRLTDWAHPEATLRVEWGQDPDKAVSVQEPAAHIVAGEDQFEGQLCRLGHGLQRSYILALLQELATTNDEAAPTLLLGCEEPELYQHPPQARHLFDVFQKLSKDNAQIIVSSHSPHFVSGDTFEDVRLIRKDPTTKCTTATNITYDEIAHAIADATGDPVLKPVGIRAKMQQALQANLNEMFFAQRLIFVEGLEDVAYITAYLHLTGRWEEYRRRGTHTIPVGGKDRLIQPLAIANAMRIPSLVIADSDGHEYGLLDPTNDPEGKKAARRVAHVRDNNAILKLAGSTATAPFPTTALFDDRVVLWHSEIGAVVEEDIGADQWRQYKEAVEQELGQPGGMEKNVIQIALRLAKAWDEGKRSAHLERLCAQIVGEPPAPAPRPAAPIPAPILVPLLVAPATPAQAPANRPS